MTPPLPTRPARIRFVPCPPERRAALLHALQRLQAYGASLAPPAPVQPTAPEPCLAPCDA